MLREHVRHWEITGAFFLIIAGVLLSFAFDWSNQALWVGIFSPVNESVWEHLKLGYWSLIFFSAIEYWFVRDKVHNFAWAKAAGVLILQASVLLVYYTYTMFTSKPILILDISSYVLGCILCQVISYKILAFGNFVGRNARISLNRLGMGILIVHAVLLIVFTFYPPQLPLFYDPQTSSYGIQ